MNMAERSCSMYQPPPPHRRKTPSFSSSLLDSILRSIDETNHDTLHHVQQQQQQQQQQDHDLLFFANSEPKRSIKINNQQQQQRPSLRRAIMIDQWMDTHNNNNNNNNRNSYSRKFSSDSSTSGTTTTFTTSSETTETPPSTYRSLPNSFTISRDEYYTQKAKKPVREEAKFIKSTRLRAMKIYGDLKKPISPGTRFSAFIYSLFSSSSSKKSKLEDSMQNFRSLKKSRSIKQQQQQDTCTTFSRSCMSKKQHMSSSVKRSVRFYPDNDNDRKYSKSIHDQRDTKYERRWFTKDNNYMINKCVEDDDEDEDDLFELEIVGGVAYRQELPVFETTDLRKIRI